MRLEAATMPVGDTFSSVRSEHRPREGPQSFRAKQEITEQLLNLGGSKAMKRLLAICNAQSAQHTNSQNGHLEYLLSIQFAPVGSHKSLFDRWLKHDEVAGTQRGPQLRVINWKSTIGG